MVYSSNYTIKQLAEIVDAEIIGDSHQKITQVASLDDSIPQSIAFYHDKKYKKALSTTKVSAVILKKEMSDTCSVIQLLVDDPHLAFAKIAQKLHPLPTASAGIHPQAVTTGATIDPSAIIAAKVVIGAGAIIEAGVYIGSGCVIGQNAQIKKNSYLSANISVMDHMIIGERCIIHAGAVIGSDGFGFAKDGKQWLKIPQIGRVVIGDDVEIGANTAIDRGAIKDTIIADGVKLDNQIHIAHNVQIGKNTAIAACVGIAGSTTIGENCTFAGMVGVTGHINIADDIFITGATPVTRSLTKSGAYSGNVVVMENKHWRKSNARFRKLDDMYKKIVALEKKLAAIEEKKS